MNDRIKICVLGDASENTANYVRPLRAMGHEVRLLSLRSPVAALQQPWVESLNVGGKWEYLFRWRDIRKWIRKNDPDLLIGYRLTSYGLLAALSGFRPLAVTATGFDVLWNSGPTTRLRRAMVRYVLSRADLCICWEQHLADALPREGLTLETFVQPRGVPLERFTPGTIPPEDRPPVVVSTRTLKKWYRVDILLRAFCKVSAAVPNSRLRIIGDGPEKANLERLTEELGLGDRVSFLGRVEPDGVAETLAESSVYVTQIAFDGVSASLLEAMASRVFPVVPDIAANRTWVTDGQGALLFPPGDEAGLASCLIRALNEPRLRSTAAEINLRVVSQRGNRETNMRRIADRFVSLVHSGRADGDIR